jgi:hypothetical protein
MKQNVSSSSDLTTDLMLEIWKRVYEEGPYKHSGPPNDPFCMDLARADVGLSIPAAFVKQRIANTLDYKFRLPERSMRVEDALNFRAYVLTLDALAQMDEEPEDPEKVFESENILQIQKLRLPITVVALGDPAVVLAICEVTGNPCKYPSRAPTQRSSYRTDHRSSCNGKVRCCFADARSAH